MIEMWRKLSEAERGIAFWKCSVICDEEYKNLCRLTAEKCEAGHIAVVCTVYGGRIQSVTCDEEEFSVLFPMMKNELAQLLDQETEGEEREAELDRFFARYTTAKVYKRKLVGEKL